MNLLFRFQYPEQEFDNWRINALTLGGNFYSLRLVCRDCRLLDTWRFPCTVLDNLRLRTILENGSVYICAEYEFT